MDNHIGILAQLINLVSRGPLAEPFRGSGPLPSAQTRTTSLMKSHGVIIGHLLSAMRHNTHRTASFILHAMPAGATVAGISRLPRGTEAGEAVGGPQICLEDSPARIVQPSWRHFSLNRGPLPIDHFLLPR